MIASIPLLAEIHFNQILVIGLGYIISNCLYSLKSEKITISSVYSWGFLWFALIGALALLSPKPRFTICLLTLIFCITLLRKKIIELIKQPQSFKASCASILKSCAFIYYKYALTPFLVFLPIAIFFLSHFTNAEISKVIDPWLLIERTKSYKVPDHYLQWIVADNFYNLKALETGFNLDGKQLWSAGDRPVLIGLLDATFSQLTKNHIFNLYYLRVIFIASLLFTVLFNFLKEEFQIEEIWKRVIILLVLGLHPFFLVNTIFTWPKMAGLSFGIMGFALFSYAKKNNCLASAISSGVAFALALISHSATLFCLLAAIIYFAIKYLINRKVQILRANQIFKLSFSALLPLILITQLHSQLLSRVTNQTNLLPRVQFCRGGSYAFVTPVESVFSACKRYYASRGISGIIADRKESLSRAFDFRPIQYSLEIKKALLAPAQLGEFLRSLNSSLLLMVSYSIGHFSFYLMLGFFVLYLISLKIPLLAFSNSSLLLPIGFSLLFLYSCLLGEYSEMSAHVVPYIIPLFISLGICIELLKASKLSFLVYSFISLAFSISIILARLGML